jgi:hypothetical protein
MAKKTNKDNRLKSGPMSFIPGKDVNGHRYFDTDLNVMLYKPYGWMKPDDVGFGDALLRTGRAFLAWGREEMQEGMLSCFRKFDMINYKNKYWYQGARAPLRHGEDDFSRDQLSGFIYSMFLRGDKERMFEIIKHIPYRISRRFIMTPDFWLWIKAIQGKKWAEILWHISNIITLPIMIHGWNRLVNLIMGYKEIGQNDYKPYEILLRHQKFNKVQKFLDSSFYPSYATHHVCWYLECVPDSFLKKCVQKIILWQVEKGNYVERLLCGDKTVTQKDVDSYIPMTEYRWSSKLNGSEVGPTRIPEEWDEDLIEKLKVNQMDRDMLLWLWEKKKTEWGI